MKAFMHYFHLMLLVSRYFANLNASESQSIYFHFNNLLTKQLDIAPINFK